MTIPSQPAFDEDEGDDTPFALPLLGLYADLELGHGAIHLPDEFHAAPRAVQLRVLEDWLKGLQALHDAASAAGPGSGG